MVSDIEQYSVWQCKEDAGFNSSRTATVLFIQKETPDVPTLITFVRVRTMSDAAMRDLAAANKSMPRVSYDTFTWSEKDFLKAYEPAEKEDH